MTQSKFLTRIFQFSFRIRLRPGLSDNRAWIPGNSKDFLARNRTKMILGPTHTPIRSLPGATSPGVIGAGIGLDHSTPTNTEVKNKWHATYIPPCTSYGSTLLNKGKT